MLRHPASETRTGAGIEKGVEGAAANSAQREVPGTIQPIQSNRWRVYAFDTGGVNAPGWTNTGNSGKLAGRRAMRSGDVHLVKPAGPEDDRSRARRSIKLVQW
jgi:hypothetical protein